MKKFITLLTAFALILGTGVLARTASAAQGPYTITFDEYPESAFGTQIGEQYASLGIHFTALPPVDPPMTTPFYFCTVYTAGTWPTTPFSFPPIPPGQFLAFHKPQGANANTGVGMMFDYYCSQIGFKYRRPGGTATAQTLFLVQLFDTAKSGKPFYATQLEAIVKPPTGSDSDGYLSFSLIAPAPFNMVLFAATKKFMIDNLSITPSASASKPTLDDPYPSQAGNVVKASESRAVDSASVGPNFVWSGKKPDGTPLPLWDPNHPSGTGGIGKDTGLFVAPSDGNFAGSYQITVTHQPTGVVRNFTVVVPVKIVADDTLIFTAGGAKKTFHAYGAEILGAWEVFPDNLSTAPGTLTTKSDGGKTNNKLEFTPAGSLGDAVVFRLKAIAAGDTDQEYVGYSPKVFVLPVATLEGWLSDPANPTIDWTTVHAKAKLLKAEGEPTANVAVDGSFSFDLPKADRLGVTYSVKVTADGYVPRTFKELSAGESYGLLMKPKAGSISGNVKSGGANLEGATVVAYKEVSVGGALKKESSEPVSSAANGNFTINLQTSPADSTVDGSYTVIASKDGYVKAVAAGIVINSSLGLKDVNAANYASLNMAMTEKTLLTINRREWDHDSNPLTPVVTDLSFTARQTTFTGTADLTGPTLAALTVDGTHTTNLGSLGLPSLSGTSITCRYTPSNSDSLIGIQAQAYAATAFKSDLVNYSFLVHPDSGASSYLTTIAPVDPNVGTTVGDASQTALVMIPFNGLTNLTAASVFIERVGSTDTTVEGSDIVEIAIRDGSGNDLGNVVNADNPLEITIQFDPKVFDPSKFTIYYRSKTGGSWAAWVDGIKDGSITVSCIDLVNNTITFKATHLTAFGVGAPAAATGGGAGDGSGGTGGGGGGDSAPGSLSPIGGPGVGGAGCFISTILE